MATTTGSALAAGTATDARLREAVLEELRGNGRTASPPIYIDVLNRIVFVHGAIPSQRRFGEIEAVVEEVSDVAEVIDELEVEVGLD